MKQGEETKHKPSDVSPGMFHSDLQPRTQDFHKDSCCPGNRVGHEEMLLLCGRSLEYKPGLCVSPSVLNWEKSPSRLYIVTPLI